jgi:hypothetical protein
VSIDAGSARLAGQVRDVRTYRYGIILGHSPRARSPVLLSTGTHSVLFLERRGAGQNTLDGVSTYYRTTSTVLLVLVLQGS